MQPVVMAVSTEKKTRTTDDTKKTETPEAKKPATPAVASVAIPVHGRIWELPDEDVDMVDWSVSDEDF